MSRTAEYFFEIIERAEDYAIDRAILLNPRVSLWSESGRNEVAGVAREITERVISHWLRIGRVWDLAQLERRLFRAAAAAVNREE